MMEDDPDYGYYCETGEDNVTPVNAKRRELIASNVCYPNSVDKRALTELNSIHLKYIIIIHHNSTDIVLTIRLLIG